MIHHDDVLSRGTESPFLSALHAKQTFPAINLASQLNTVKLSFSSQVRKQFKLLAVRSQYDVVCEVISL